MNTSNLGKNSSGEWVPMGATTDSAGNPASNAVISDGAAVGPASADTDDVSFTQAFTSSSAGDTLTTLLSGLSAGDIIRCFADQDCYIRFNDADENASSSSMYFPAGTELIKIPTGATHMEVIRVSADGTLYVTKVS